MRLRARAFTLVELLVVIGIIALLVAILMPSLNKARYQAKNVACEARLRNVGQAVLMYANENRGKIPQHPGRGSWLWDVPFGTRDALVKKGGARQTLYCPFFPEQDADNLWDYSTAALPGGQFGVIGYVWLGKRPHTGYPSLTNGARAYVETLRPPKPPTGTAAALAALFPKISSDTEIMTDPVFQQAGQPGWAAKGGWPDIHVTPHIRHNQPQGGNILFLDWHVAFRPFKEMKRRALFGSPQLEYWF